MSAAERSTTDFYAMDDLLTQEEKDIRRLVREFCDREVLPVINDYWEYVLDGAKRWIGNASFADIVVIRTRGEDGKVGGYLFEKGSPGFRAEAMTGKTALRAVWQADVTLE